MMSETESFEGHEKRLLIACMMIEDEVRKVLDETGTHLPVVWVEKGFHEYPEKLRAELQRQIDLAEDSGYDQILLAFGLCGNGAVGLVTKRATLAILCFDDCINFMLCPQCREKRGYAKAGVMYLTKGWSDSQFTVKETRRRYIEQFGERRGNRLVKHMWGGYHKVSVIDTQAYDLDPIVEIGKENASELEVEFDIDRGYTHALRKLVSGGWDSDIIVVGAGQPINQQMFDWCREYAESE